MAGQRLGPATANQVVVGWLAQNGLAAHCNYQNGKCRTRHTRGTIIPA